MDGAREQCLTVVMPCFNEELTLKLAAERALESPFTRELIIVNDGSTDQSLDIARGIADSRVRVLDQPCNLGKGAAIRRGFDAATSPYVIVQDADMEYDPDDYQEVLGPLLADQADVVYGSRFLAGRPHRVLYFWHAVGNRFLTTASNMLSNLNMTDMETCYKAFRREVIQSLDLREDGFGIEAEITAKVAKGKWRIYEVGISYAGRTYDEGKKIGWRDGFWAIYCVVRYSPLWDKTFGTRHREPAPLHEADEELAEALHSLSGAENYADWIYDLAAPYLGESVLEIGAGHGTMTERFAEGRRVTATDVSARCTELLERRFAAEPNVRVHTGAATPEIVGTDYDSIVLVNVLEHIEDDVKALAELATMLRPGGRMILYVPAFDTLYSDFDAKVGHHRRYRRSGLAQAVDRAGLRVVDLRYVNSAGALAWWLFARQLRQTPSQPWSVKLYDRVLVPLMRRRETRKAPRVGQSLFCVVERPAAT